jgi:glyoxylase-like metal-dependent hydrolase (beta-lactamase superfamily II)
MMFRVVKGTCASVIYSLLLETVESTVDRVEIIPLGGIGEFGMNCMGLRYRDQMIIIDAGMGFPEETPYGVDISIPNFDFLEEYRSDIVGLILTHGHEDHIGALPYFLKKFNVPVYASRFTAALAGRRLEEHQMLGSVLLHTVRPNDVTVLGDLKVEYIHASHSLVDCFSLAITTPVGVIIHTGDYKIDDTPVIGAPYDLETVRRHLKGRPEAAPAACPGDDGLYAYALAHGLEAALAKVSDDIVIRSLRENGGKRTRTMTDLKISTRLLYATLKRLGLDGDGEKK